VRPAGRRRERSSIVWAAYFRRGNDIAVSRRRAEFRGPSRRLGGTVAGTAQPSRGRPNPTLERRETLS